MEKKRLINIRFILCGIAIVIIGISLYSINFVSKAIWPYPDWTDTSECREGKDADGTWWGYRVMEDGTAEVIYFGPANKKCVVVPKTIDGYQVTKLSESCFAADPLDAVADDAECILEKVIISEGITIIGDGAFSGCLALKNVVLPSTLTEIGKQAFSDCSSLKSIVIPPNVKKCDSAFVGCDRLKSVTLSWGIKTVPENAFAFCKNLTKVDIPYTVTNIGEYAFENCINLTNINIPSSVRKIGQGAFLGCTNLKNITIPSSVRKIDQSAFSDCTGLKKVYIYRKNIDIYLDENPYWNKVFERMIDASAFSDCPNLTIYGPAGGTGEKYAKKKNVPFEATTKRDDISTFHIQLSREVYTYNGRAKKPTVTVKSNRGVLKEINYTIQYRNNVNIGKATIIIKGKGRYTGTLKKTFTIRLTTPKVSAKNGNSGIRVSWKKITGARGYYVYRKTGNGSWKKIGDIRSANRVYYIDKKAKTGNRYRYTVRAYSGRIKSKFKSTKVIECK